MQKSRPIWLGFFFEKKPCSFMHYSQNEILKMTYSQFSSLLQGIG